MSKIIRFASMDLGIHNLSIEIEDCDVSQLKSIKNIPMKKRYDKNGEPTDEFKPILNSVYKSGKSIYSHNKNVWEGKKQYVDEPVLLALTQYLDTLPLLKTCDIVIIERQMKTNHIAKPIENHIRSELLRLFKYDPNKKIVIYAASNKTKVLGAPKYVMHKGKLIKMTKIIRKKWAVEKAGEILKLRGDQETYDQIFRVENKRDDISDCIIQLQSAKYKIFVDKSLKDCSSTVKKNSTDKILDKLKEHHYEILDNDNSANVFKTLCPNKHLCYLETLQINNIPHEKWCQTCYFLTRSIEFNIFQEMIKKKFEGRCLSQFFDSDKEKLEFECKFDHKFWASVRDVKEDIWCTECSYKIIGKELTRFCFETLYNKKFPSTSLLDGYNKDLKIGFVYCLNDDDFIVQELNEIEKHCSKNNIEYVIINYSLPVSKIKELICNKLSVSSINVEFKKHPMYKLLDKSLEELKEVAYKHKAQCLCKISLPAKKKIPFKCKHGEIFESTKDTINRKNVKGECICKCSEKITDICEYVLESGKSKGNKCKNKVSIDSESGKHCKKHSKFDKLITIEENIVFEDDEILFLD